MNILIFIQSGYFTAGSVDWNFFYDMTALTFDCATFSDLLAGIGWENNDFSCQAEYFVSFWAVTYDFNFEFQQLFLFFEYLDLDFKVLYFLNNSLNFYRCFTTLNTIFLWRSVLEQ